jgi:hypothetical protein
VAAIGAVEGRADKGIFCQLANQIREQCPLLSVILRLIEAAIAPCRLPAQLLSSSGAIQL